jgi:hypothetical protein
MWKEINERKKIHQTVVRSRRGNAVPMPKEPSRESINVTRDIITPDEDSGLAYSITKEKKMNKTDIFPSPKKEKLRSINRRNRFA